MGHTIGIDLGTTYSAVARVNADGEPEILTNRDGENVTPSIVLFSDGVPLVGTMAKRSAASAPLDVVQFVKRSMGDPSWRFETSEGTSFRPEEISALIIKRLKEDAELALGGEVTDAVITVPAYFDDAPRRATMDAGRIAGLAVRRVINEPTAAALAYGLHERTQGRVLVYDLGGGTFDVTVMRIAEGTFEVLATAGDRNLGGFDWDNALMRLLDERFRAAGGPSLLDEDGDAEGVAEADLRDKTEIAKHSLTTVDQTRVVLASGGVTKAIPLTRSEFEDATSSLLSRTRDIAGMVVEDAGLTWDAIDHVLLAGGSTRMPMIRAMLGEATGSPPLGSINPDEVVALGAAIQAHLVDREDAEGAGRDGAGRDGAGAGDGGRGGDRDQTGDRAELAEVLPVLALPGGSVPTVTDVTSQGLGVIALNDTTGAEENVVIIPPNTTVPARRGEVFQTVRDRQDAVDVEVTQGDDSDPAYVRTLGKQTIAIPAYPSGARLEVGYSYDVDQTVGIEVRDVQSGEPVGSFSVHNVANMSEDEVGHAIRKVGGIEVG